MLMSSIEMKPSNYFSTSSTNDDFLSKPKTLSRYAPTKVFRSFRSGSSYKFGPTLGDDRRRSFNAEVAAWNTANTALVRRLKGRHIQMIAIGASIGTGLYIESGAALAEGGPASLLIAFLLLSFVLYCVMQALGEMSVAFPIAGSFGAFATRFVDPAWGFAFGWNYALQWTIIFPLEIISAVMTLNYWGSPIPVWAATAIFLLIIITINLFNVKVYGEIEYTLSVLKVAAVIGFIILGAVINCGGTQDSGLIGVRYWKSPGAFHNGLKGFCNMLVTATFSFTGTELMALAAAETQNPSKAFPTAIKQAFWCIISLNIISIILIGLLVPYDAPQLRSIAEIDTKASPFIIAIQSAGINGLDLVMNAIVMISVLSVANSSMYGATRTFAALAEQGQAPRCMAYVDKKGCPLVCITLVSLFGMTAFLYGTSIGHTVFNWLLTLSGLSTIIAWCSICYSHIAFRRAWAFQSLQYDDLIYRSPIGIMGSYTGLVLLFLIFVAQFWVAISPRSKSEQMSTTERIMNSFGAFLAVPIMLVLYFGYKLWYRTKLVSTADVDLVTGRNAWESEIQRDAWNEERSKWPFWKVLCRSLF